MLNPAKSNTENNYIQEEVKELFRQNEIQANKLVSLTMQLLSAGLIISWVLNIVGVFHLDRLYFTVFVFIAVACFWTAVLIARKYRGYHPKMKYFLMSTLILACAMMDAMLSYNIALFIAFPLILSLRYYSEKYTIWIAVDSAIAFALSAALGTWFQVGIVDLNFADVVNDTLVTAGEDIYSAIERSGGFARWKSFYFYMTEGFTAKLLQYAIFTVIAFLIARCGKEMVIKQAEISAETARIESELSVARNIQANMLPVSFPAFPDRDEFDIFATMTPAKEVGGDFYDFFMVDERHVAVVMADVSGKGVPAALFMAIAKAMLKDHTEPDEQLSQTFTKVNNLLCESNKEQLFVTAFEGVLDFETGEFIFVNAGHCRPLVYRKAAGEFQTLDELNGLALACFEDLQYDQGVLTLQKGDAIYLYTDGVTEAMKLNGEMYGTDRLTAFLNANAEAPLSELLFGIRKDVDSFVGENPQFDDITMLMLRLNE